MKFFVTLIGLVVMLQSVFSIQNESIKIEGVVLSKEKKEKLSFVNIGLKGANKSWSSNEHGNFRLFLKNINLQDSIIFSCVGFKKKVFVAEQLFHKLKSDTSIFLEEKTKWLNQLMIKPKTSGKITLGKKKSIVSIYKFFYSNPFSALASEMSYCFELPQPSILLDELTFYLSHNEFKKVVLRINVYNLQDGLPQENILKENILFTIAAKQKGKQSIDLSEYSVEIDQDFCLSLEFVKIDNYKFQTLVSKKKGKLVFSQQNKKEQKPIGFKMFKDQKIQSFVRSNPFQIWQTIPYNFHPIFTLKALY